MARIELPYVAWREGRPRFVPGARERKLGFKGQDLKHDDGRWFSLDEARAFAIAKQQDIAAQRKKGGKLKTPPAPRGRAVQDLWAAYIASAKFKSLAQASQKSYREWIKPVKAEPVWLSPVGALDPVILKAMHERIMAARSVGVAKGALAALSAALSWGRLHGWFPKIGGVIAASPATRLDLPSPDHRLVVYDDAEIRALLAASDRLDQAEVAPGVKLSAIGDAILTGLFSGQREGDILAFIPGEKHNDRVELVQSKTKARVSIPRPQALVDRLDAGRARRARAGYVVEAQNIIINERAGMPYNQGTFMHHFALVRSEAAKQCPSVAGKTFADLRDTAVTWYARAGCTVPEIASITGHSLRSIYTILKHYLALDAHLADNAVRKLVDYMEREGLAV